MRILRSHKILDGDKAKEAKEQVTFIYWSDR